jgi:gliding motility-associated lipoprotein GldH
MKRALTLYTVLIAFIMLLGTGCTDPNTIFDQNTAIPGNNWSYLNKLIYTVKIDNAGIPCNLCLNLRVTANYKYSNIFVLIHQHDPGKKDSVTRYEFKLANPDGEWLGNGSGNVYSYQVPFRTNYKFPVKGVYRFEIEENMRDNPLREVIDAGLRVEKAAP